MTIYDQIKSLPKELQAIIIQYHKEIYYYLNSKEIARRQILPLCPFYYFTDDNGYLLLRFT